MTVSFKSQQTDPQNFVTKTNLFFGGQELGHRVHIVYICLLTYSTGNTSEMGLYMPDGSLKAYAPRVHINAHGNSHEERYDIAFSDVTWRFCGCNFCGHVQKYTSDF